MADLKSAISSPEENTKMKPQQKILLDGLTNFYKERVMCDITLKAEDIAVPAHRCVLAASSPYFRAMFTFEVKEMDQEEITLYEISGCILEDLVTFFYSGEITLNKENVQGLVCAADMMQILSLRNQCEQFMISALCLENCVEVYNFADFQNLDKLKMHAESFILNNFQDALDQDAFVNITIINLTQILGSDDLNVGNEETVYEAVMKWVKFDVDMRKSDLFSLLFCIRFPFMDSDYIEDIVCNEFLFLTDDLCREMIEEVKNLNVFDDNLTTETQFNQRPRLGMYYKKMLVFSGGCVNSATERSFGCFDPENKESFHAIKHHPTFDYKFKIDHYKLIVTDRNDIFFLGGVSYDEYHYSSVGIPAKANVLIFNQSRRKWEECSSMLSPRCAFGVCYYSYRIYVFGGYAEYPDKPPQNTTFIYDIEADDWEEASHSMQISSAHQSVAVFKDKAYILGGKDTSDFYLNTIQILDLLLNTWSVLTLRLPQALAEATAVTHKDKIFLVGGCNAAGNNLSVLIFDPIKEKWKYGEEFPDDRKFTSVTKGDGSIFVCGGMRQFFSRSRQSRTTETKDLFKYDIANNSWSQEARLVEYGSSYCCAYANINTKYLKASNSNSMFDKDI